MAREPERKLVEVTFRCLDEEGFSFTGKMEYVGHEIKEPGGGTRGSSGGKTSPERTARTTPSIALC
jgi:hypothetical protein